jgi:hypothetical protein
MEIFSCFRHERNRSVPSLSFLLTSSLERARELVRRELLHERDALFVEICDGNRVLWTETAAGSPDECCHCG